MERTELASWIGLSQVEGIGSLGFRTLLQAFGSPRAVFQATPASLKIVPGIGDILAGRIKDFAAWDEVERQLRLLEAMEASVLPFTDPSYPRRLLHIYDYPPVLYVRGTLRPEDVPVAVVGSRSASTYGRYSTERLCRELALKGITVVSGMARGIDSAAHRGALAGKGRTVAVLGSGLDVVYPPENRDLFAEIARLGAVVTEFPPGTQPLAANFPARNRIISGISLGVVVVEATEKSGSLITARLALEQGREVFAVPGSIDAAGSRGTNKLIKEGARLVESADDVIAEILPQLREPSRPSEADGLRAEAPSQNETPAAGRNEAPPAALSPEEQSVLSSFPNRASTIDDIIAATALPAGDVLPVLLRLELKGLIVALPGSHYARKESA